MQCDSVYQFKVAYLSQFINYHLFIYCLLEESINPTDEFCKILKLRCKKMQYFIILPGSVKSPGIYHGNHLLLPWQPQPPLQTAPSRLPAEIFIVHYSLVCNKCHLGEWSLVVTYYYSHHNMLIIHIKHGAAAYF